MATHYQKLQAEFQLFSRPGKPNWRSPQRGALGALLGYWSLPRETPALISVPTGSGKSAIATAAPYLAGSARVLVVVPSVDLRKQLAADFGSEGTLRAIGAREGDAAPNVVALTGRVKDWAEVEVADVVVAIPASISPEYYRDNLPPADLFDLVIVDEAHHLPARTWAAIPNHFESAKCVLLTATPTRRDGKRIPGSLIYHYPLRQALEENIYKPVTPEVLDIGLNPSQSTSDSAIVARIVELAAKPEHASSSILIRASSIARAKLLAGLYETSGLPVTVLTSRDMTPQRRQDVVAKLRTGEVRAVAVVDMLGEGFDLPSMRIAAYHDKHKSSVASVQLIGRLARVNDAFPQESVLVTSKDQDIYPQLQGVVRELWEEDSDWARVLPGLIDDEVEAQVADQGFAAALESAPPELSVQAVAPIVRGVLYEVADLTWQPSFVEGVIPDSLRTGQRIRGQTVFYAAVTPSARTLILVLAATTRPKWHADAGLDSQQFDIHLVTWREAKLDKQHHILAVNSADQSVAQVILEALGAVDQLSGADPGRLQDAFDSLNRVSVSNVGVRNTYLGSRGVPSYKMFAGSGVDRGLRDADTGRGALGHAMAQISADGHTHNVGIATGKSKFWESRYVRLRQYEEYINDYIGRYWLPPAGGPGRLLPGVARGELILEMPDGLVVTIEPDPALYSSGWEAGGVSVGDLLLEVDPSGQRDGDHLPLIALDPENMQNPVWAGWLDRHGIFNDLASPTEINRGFGSKGSLAELLSQRPPSIYFANGKTVIGRLIFDPPTVGTNLPAIGYANDAWGGVDFTAETHATATNHGIGISIDEALEALLLARPPRRRHRWLLSNDGAKELADYILLEVDPGPIVSVELWHAKAASKATSSVRLKDMQVVIAQAIKSRRWATDRTLWSVLRDRYNGDDSPALTVVAGSPRLLSVLLGLTSHERYSFVRYPPRLTCTIGIAQPGLSESKLRGQLSQTVVPVPAQQIRELLTVWHDAVNDIASLELVVSQ